MSKKHKVKFKNLKIREETQSKLQTIALMLGKSQAQILSEYVTELYALMALFNGSVSITYDSSVLSETLTIGLLGASKMIHGRAPSDAVAKEQIESEIEARQNE